MPASIQSLAMTLLDSQYNVLYKLYTATKFLSCTVSKTQQAMVENREFFILHLYINTSTEHNLIKILKHDSCEQLE